MLAFSRVTVIGSNRRVDVSLPEAVPVADLILDLVQMLAEGAKVAPARWALVKVGGHPLDPERTLAEQAVAAGTMLFLTDLTAQPPPPAVEDFGLQVAIAVDAEIGGWKPDMIRPLLVGAGAVCLFVAGLISLLALNRGPRTVAGLLGAALTSLLALALVRFAGRRDFARVICLASLPLWAAAGAGLAAVAGAGGTGILASALAAVTIAALVAFLIAGESVLAATGGLIGATLLPALVFGGCELAGAGIVPGAGILCPLGLAGLAIAAPLSARFSGITTADAASLADRMRRGRQLLAAVLTGIALMLVVSTAILAFAGGWFAWGLIAAVTIGTGSKALHLRFSAEVMPVIAAAVMGLLLLQFPLVTHSGLGTATAVLISDGVVLGATAGAIRSWKVPGRIHRRLLALEWIAVAASVPLAVAAAGAYAEVVRFAAGLS